MAKRKSSTNQKKTKPNNVGEKAKDTKETDFVKQWEKRVRKLQKFMEGLTDIDRINFSALLCVPSAIAKLPDGEYKDMCVLALAIRELRNKRSDNKGGQDVAGIC